MRTVIFCLAGKREKPHHPVILFSKQREYRQKFTIFHRNDFSTILEIPIDFFKKHFAYDRWAGIYRTSLTWKDVEKFCCFREHF